MNDTQKVDERIVKSNHPNEPESDLPQLAAPARRALAAAGYVRLEQLTKITEAEIKALHGIGPNALETLRSTLRAKGMSFADDLE
ncbi:MAG: DNA-binding protein [Chloroflexi bacterium]|nr:DNA-binding protein [Chloroflexota bacterium]